MRIPADELASLNHVERLGLAFAGWMNETPAVQRAFYWLNLRLQRRILLLGTSRRTHLIGLDRIVSLRPDRGVIMAANHRTFLDQFAILVPLVKNVGFWRRWFFPVRSDFFYDNPLGILVNFLASSCNMYPPIFRPRSKRGVTRACLDYLIEQLRSPETFAGIHPEGTRGKGPDPYQLLPAEPGFGRILLQSRAIVIPVFVNGISDNLAREAIHNYTGTGPPVIIAFGAPVDMSAFDEEDPRLLRNQVKAGRRVLEEVARLGEEERELRQRLEAGGGS